MLKRKPISQSKPSLTTNVSYSNNLKLQKKLDTMQSQVEEQQVRQKAAALGLAYINLEGKSIDKTALSLMSYENVEKYKMGPIAKSQENITMVLMDPGIPGVQDKLKEFQQQGYKLKLGLISSKSLERLLSAYKTIHVRKKISQDVLISEEQIKQAQKGLTGLKSLKERASRMSTTEVLSTIIAAALNMEVSDIHLEPKKDKVLMRMRIDGIMHDAANFPLKHYSYVLSRIKILTKMKLNVTATAQDGRFSINIEGDNVDVRVSVLPSNFGESIVMRILRQDTVNLDLNTLGISNYYLQLMRREIKKPNGIILNTGPTGSGKTTTLYSILKEVATKDVKIITVEDPIEYKVPGITQTQVNQDANYTFATGLRSILRQDPDKILVGEIRDLETAEMAMHAALTGHLVLSTLHTNDAAGAVPRLLDLGVNGTVLSPAFNVAIAQRLVRRLCPYCQEQVQINDNLQQKLIQWINQVTPKFPKQKYLENNKLKINTYYKARGCPKCNDIGYKGRRAVFEMLIFDDELRQMITGVASAVDLRNKGIEKGMVTMAQDGVFQILEGKTSFEEVSRVTDLSFFDGNF